VCCSSGLRKNEPNEVYPAFETCFYLAKAVKYLLEERREIMIVKGSSRSTRRQFLVRALPAGTLFCIGCGPLLTWGKTQEKPVEEAGKHKFLADSGMSFKEVYDFAYTGNYDILTGRVRYRRNK
jgi:hypothetical protein